MLAKFLGLNPKGQYLKTTFVLCSPFPKSEPVKLGSFMSQGCNDDKEMYKITWCIFKFVVLSIKTFYSFALILLSPLSLVLFSLRNSATMVTWRRASPPVKLTIKFQQGRALREVEGTPVLWNCEVQGVQHMFFGKKYQDSPFTQEEKLGVRQGPLGNSRALTFLITHDPPGLVAPSFY